MRVITRPCEVETSIPGKETTRMVRLVVASTYTRKVRQGGWCANWPYDLCKRVFHIWGGEDLSLKLITY